MHAAQIARVLRIAAAPFGGRHLGQQHRCASFLRYQSGAQRDIPSAAYQYGDITLYRI